MTGAPDEEIGDVAGASRRYAYCSGNVLNKRITRSHRANQIRRTIHSVAVFPIHIDQPGSRELATEVNERDLRTHGSAAVIDDQSVGGNHKACGTEQRMRVDGRLRWRGRWNAWVGTATT